MLGAMRHFILTILILGIACAAPPARATRNVSSPGVDKGVWEAEARFGMETDDRAARDRRLRQLYLVEYGVTDWYSFRLNARVQKLHGVAHDYTATEWEHKFQLFHDTEDGWNGGFKIVYSLAHNGGGANALNLVLLGETYWGAFRHRANIGWEREIGRHAESGVALDASYQVTAKPGDRLRAGAEWFGSFGEIWHTGGFSAQEHQLGPVFMYEASDSLSFEAGYLAGISRQASDGLFKFFVKKSF